MNILQVKYLETESKLNSFLKRIQKKGYKIQSIQYLPTTNTEFKEGEDTTMKVEPVAIVQYWIEEKE